MSRSVAAPFVETTGEVVRNGVLPGTRLHWLELGVGPEFPDPVPGQFIMLAPPGASAAGVLLARPFSIARAQRHGGRWRLGILYARVGRGTELMARALPGAVDRPGSRAGCTVLGPLGRGFPLDPRGPALLVGGGRGTAPLVFLAEALEARGRAVEFLVGARSSQDWAGPAEMGVTLERSRVWSASEDGSRGHRGRVLELFEREAELARALEAPGATLYACGPHGLLAAVGRLAESRKVPAYVSIEAHMACGTGICRSCVVPRNPEGPKPARGTNPEYLVSCLEGPVVPASSVDWARDRELSVGPAYAGFGGEAG